MFELPAVMALAMSRSAHAGERQAVIAANIANADTPGYVPRDLSPFDPDAADGRAAPMRASRPGHIRTAPGTAPAAAALHAAPDEIAPNGNGVSLEAQMARAAEVRRSNDLAMAVYGASAGILRGVIGR
ncbi:MAG: flagellar basal body protein [Rhodobacteraceae bacterium]|nr:flagellar basal body protein [Paracoccaceae bacterium]